MKSSRSGQIALRMWQCEFVLVYCCTCVKTETNKFIGSSLTIWAKILLRFYHLDVKNGLNMHVIAGMKLIHYVC